MSDNGLSGSAEETLEENSGAGSNDDAAARLEAAVLARTGIEGRQLSDGAYSRRRLMLILTSMLFAFTIGGFRLSEINFNGLKIAVEDERRLWGFLLLLLLYSVGDFALFAWPEIGKWRSDMNLFELRYGHGTEVIADNWSKLLRNARRILGSSHSLVKDIEWRQRLSREAQRRFVRMHRARMFWESLFPVGIATATILLVLFCMLF